MIIYVYYYHYHHHYHSYIYYSYYHYREYYALRVEAWITEDSTPTYMLRVERSLEEEKARVAEYLNTESEPKLLQVWYSVVYSM